MHKEGIPIKGKDDTQVNLNEAKRHRVWSAAKAWDYWLRTVQLASQLASEVGIMCFHIM